MMNLIQLGIVVRVFRNIGRFTKMTVEHNSTKAKVIFVHYKHLDVRLL